MTTDTPQKEAVIGEDDLLKLLRASNGAILIGGQALAFWVAYFDVDISAGPRAYISADAGFLGFKEHVKAFSRAIGGRPAYPGKREITALTGAVIKETKDGAKIGVDVLHRIVGIPSSAVERRAVEVEHPKDPSLRFRVMDPVDCMVSRFENLRRLAQKRNNVGIWQATIGVDICRAYLKQLIDSGLEKKAIRAATAILKLAGTAPGLQVFWKYGVDLIGAIPIERFRTEAFKREQYARTVANIKKIRSERNHPAQTKMPIEEQVMSRPHTKGGAK